MMFTACLSSIDDVAGIAGAATPRRRCCGGADLSSLSGRF
jgi:hypothetical protein